MNFRRIVTLGTFVLLLALLSISHAWMDSDEARAADWLLPAFVGLGLILVWQEWSTSRREAALEAAHRESQERLERFFEHSPASIFIKNAEGRYVHVNRRFLQVFGLRPEDVIGRTDDQIFPPDQAAAFRENDQKVIESGIGQEFEEVARYTDGEHIHLVQKFPLRDLDGRITAVCGIATDITERKLLEAQLRQAQKLDSIGQLAGGVAHDFNNILTVISGHASLVQSMKGLSPDILESAQQITAAADRAADLTRQLLTFSRRQLLQKRDLDLNEIVADMAKMLHRIVGEHISIEFHPAATPPMVHADRGMMEQILLNLAVNARDAMPRGGKLTLSIGRAVITSEIAQLNPDARPGEFIRLTVTDTGFGISPDLLPHIFEPFFTTKDIGKGTGLGLATVYGIVQQHRGWISVDSQPDEGTSFQIYLPVLLAPSTEVRLAPKPAPNSAGSETILVVEDEEQLRILVRAILERRGYRVFEARSGAAALEVWQQHKSVIDLLFTDMVMPGGIDGRQLAERLRVDRPNLKVIFTSGYPANAVAKNFQLREGVDYLQKPYQPAKLAAFVRAVLDGKAESSKAPFPA